MATSTQPIIIKKVKKAAHGHHGGAWKIAYADFVTAMMAFFLLMWLINMTTQDQKKGLADYFSPTSVSNSKSGAGGILSGTALDDRSNKAAGANSEPSRRAPSPREGAMGTTAQDDGTQRNGAGRASDRDATRATNVSQAHHSAIASIRQALESKPEIADLSRNIVIEPTKDGLNVSLVDEDGRSMFPDGSVQPFKRTRLVLEVLGPTLRRLPNRLSITGHTTARRPGSGGRTTEPWSLTAGRALAVRDILAGVGLSHDRFASVVGRADTDPYFPDNPYLSANRRVTITLLSEEAPLPQGVLR